MSLGWSREELSGGGVTQGTTLLTTREKNEGFEGEESGDGDFVLR